MDKRQLLYDWIGRILGFTTREGSARLDKWRQDKRHERQYRQIMQADDLHRRYLQYSEINADKAWRQFRNHYFPVRKHYFRYAIAVAVLVAVTGTVALHWHSSQGSLPQLSSIDYRQQAQSSRQGRQGAVLQTPDKRTLKLSDAKNLSDLKSSEYADGDYQLATGKGKEFWITLEDGTIVHLNYNTKLKFPVHFSSDCRKVYLEGEAYFMVAKSADRPFIVVTPTAMVKEYGTEFSVNTNGAKDTEVALVEGKISVIRKSVEYPLNVGEIAKVSAAHVDITKRDLSPLVSWNKGEYVFRNCKLDVLMDVLEQWYGVNVEIESDDIRNMKFSGNIDKYGKIDHLLHAIEKLTGLDIDKCNNIVTIKKSSSYED